MSIDPGVAGFLALLAGLAGFAFWRTSRERRAVRCIAAHGYVAVTEPPVELLERVARHFGGRPGRAWRRDDCRWAIELLPREDEEESTLRLAVTAPLEPPFNAFLLFRAWQGADPDRLPGRLGVGLLALGDERLAGLRRLPDPHRRLGSEGAGYLAYAGSEMPLESMLPDAFLDRLQSLAQTVWAVVVSGPDLLLLTPFDRAQFALAEAPELATRIGNAVDHTDRRLP